MNRIVSTYKENPKMAITHGLEDWELLHLAGFYGWRSKELGFPLALEH